MLQSHSCWGRESRWEQQRDVVLVRETTMPWMVWQMGGCRGGGRGAGREGEGEGKEAKVMFAAEGTCVIELRTDRGTCISERRGKTPPACLIQSRKGPYRHQ